MGGERRQDINRRLLWVAGCLALFGVVLVYQLVRWQLVRGRSLADVATKENVRHQTLDAKRGSIFSADGRPLATDVYAFDLTAAPELVEDPYQLADRLFPLIGVKRDDLAQRLDSKAVWQPLAEAVPLRLADEIKSWDEPGLSLEPVLSRAYPDKSMYEPVLGFVNRARDGYYGVEGFYDAQLRGEPGASLGEMDALGLDVPFGERLFEPPKDGATVFLTLDSRVQYILWRELRAGLEKYQAESGSIIVVNTRTGAILGAVSLPGYDPNSYDSVDAKLYEDPIVSHLYEPGSVFKIITMAAGLDSGAVTPDSTYDDTGKFEIAGITIHNWDNSAHGKVNMTDILAFSLNTGAAHVSTTMGAATFYKYVTAFGFGQKTGVDLQAEEAGQVKMPGDGHWYEADLATNSYGQGIAATPLQMVMAFAAVANDGLLMRPYIVDRVVSGDSVTVTQPQPVRQVISPDVARELRRMMVQAVERETQLARVPGYTVGGKTGTAQIPIPGGYHPTDTIASFIGFLPDENPEICILVKVDRPKASPWGSQVAAPIFSKVARDLVLVLGIAPQSPASAEAKQ